MGQNINKINIAILLKLCTHKNTDDRQPNNLINTLGKKYRNYCLVNSSPLSSISLDFSLSLSGITITLTSHYSLNK